MTDPKAPAASERERWKPGDPLPCSECKGQCCTYPPFSEKEWDTVHKKYGLPYGATLSTFATARIPVLSDGSGRCAYLDIPSGRCNIYPDRPQTCREYGESERLPCAYVEPEKAAQTQQTLKMKLRVSPPRKGASAR